MLRYEKHCNLCLGVLSDGMLMGYSGSGTAHCGNTFCNYQLPKFYTWYVHWFSSTNICITPFLNINHSVSCSMRFCTHFYDFILLLLL